MVSLFLFSPCFFFHKTKTLSRLSVEKIDKTITRVHCVYKYLQFTITEINTLCRKDRDKIISSIVWWRLDLCVRASMSMRCHTHFFRMYFPAKRPPNIIDINLNALMAIYLWVWVRVRVWVVYKCCGIGPTICYIRTNSNSYTSVQWNM